jgi:serine/threonine-protein kinase RsbW
MLKSSFNNDSCSQALELPSCLESIHVVEMVILQVKEKHAINEENYTGIWIAINEAVTNAIKHGNRYDPSKKVFFSIETKENRYLCFTVKDEGDGFDPAGVPDPTSAERLEEPNGRGVFLIRNFADTVKFSQNGTLLEMCFDLCKN